MNQLTISAGLAAPMPHQPARPVLSAADLPVAALGLLLAGAIATGHAVVSAPGAALSSLSVLVTGVVLVFSRRQLRADPRARSFTRLALGLAIATILMALAADILLLVAAWIVGGRLMAGLIGHVGDWREARLAARRANLSFAAGDLALVAAALLLAVGAGSSNLAAITAAAPSLDPTMMTAAAVLLVIAAMARCALPPFSAWLMRSLAAPTPVSALLHAGFVNASGFLLISLAPVLEAAPIARSMLFTVGVVAALFGSAIMLVRVDVKGSLAASTVAQMGFMLLTVGLGAYAAALWHMVAHGVFKAWLFLGSAGTIVPAATPGNNAAKMLAKPWPALVALLTIIAALALMQADKNAAVLPLGLAFAAMLAALGVALKGARRGPLGLLVFAAPFMLIGFNIAALALVSAYQANAAIPLIPDYAQFGLLSLLLAGWVWQQGIASGELTLPPALFARLFHAGHPAP